jgi:3-dehydro-L-gulonate 2-dehydrogenase
MTNNSSVLIPATEMQQVFNNILLKQGFTIEKAEQCAAIFTSNSIDGIYTHGVNRFPRFVHYVQEGFVKKDAEPSLKSKVGSLEQWDGNLGPGPLNAAHATATAMRLASEQGIGCVALANTNHWMRGGTYGWQAAKSGYFFIGFTNTIALMPAWGGIDSKLGNNPLVLAMPYDNEAIVLDMAMSQYSFGAMELAVMKGEDLAVVGGYDSNGKLTLEPAAIIDSKRPLPIGFWKGAGLSLLLDLFATILSGGFSVNEITSRGTEYGLSQVFICVDTRKLGNNSLIAKATENVIQDYHNSVKEDPGKQVTYPGERVLQTRQRNLANGIPVLKTVWESVLKLVI